MSHGILQQSPYISSSLQRIFEVERISSNLQSGTLTKIMEVATGGVL